jgi:hypothetical protein
MPSMAIMMQAYRGHCQETSTALDRRMTTMDKAQQSHDLAQIWEALAQAQPPLATMKDHMTSCMSMMSMMPQMHNDMRGKR